MKQLIILLFVQIFFINLRGQKFKISYKKSEILINPNGNYYKPQSYSKLPSHIYLAYVYEYDNRYIYKITPILKVDDNYQFKLNIEVSVPTIISSVIDSANNIVDNNGNIGFVSFLNKGKNNFNNAFSYYTAANLLSYYAQRTLKLDRKLLTCRMINLYHQAYRLASDSLKSSFYDYYLTLLYTNKKEKVKKTLLNYAKEKSNKNYDEKECISAIRIYKKLEMFNEAREIEEQCLKNFQDGELAKNRFLNKIDTSSNLSPKQLLDTFQYASKYFKTITSNDNYAFFLKLASVFYANNNWSKIYEYEYLISNKITLARIYTKYAKVFFNKELNEIANEKKNAMMLCKKAFGYLNEEIKSNTDRDKYDKTFQEDYNILTDTYAQIFFNNGEYDSAFYFQDKIYKQGNMLDVKGLERYGNYLEKIKGLTNTRQFLENNLLDGINSSQMLEQLELIYSKLKIPLNSFSILKEEARIASIAKMNERISKENGNNQAKNFTLTDMNGTKVSLSNFKNKVVVMDFWSTWCGACIASFPKMQLLLDKYKNDSDVVFLFIDVLENKATDKLKSTIKNLLKNNNYTFNVLLDAKNLLVDKYKVEYIPKKIIINKNNQIIFIGNEIDNISEIIESAKR